MAIAKTAAFGPRTFFMDVCWRNAHWIFLGRPCTWSSSRVDEAVLHGRSTKQPYSMFPLAATDSIVPNMETDASAIFLFLISSWQIRFIPHVVFVVQCKSLVVRRICLPGTSSPNHSSIHNFHAFEPHYSGKSKQSGFQPMSATSRHVCKYFLFLWCMNSMRKSIHWTRHLSILIPNIHEK